MKLAAARAWVRRHPGIADAALGVALIAVPAVLVLTNQVRDESGAPAVGDLLAVAAALVIVAGRRRWTGPLLVAGTAVAAGFVVVLGHHHPAVDLANLIIAYTFAVRNERRRAWLVAGGCAVVPFLAGVPFADGVWWAAQNLGSLAWGAAAVALGDATRSRRAYVAEVEARARRAEETREEEARRRVAEERLRIARELHDVVAHHIAVINVQAGAATHVLATRPEAAGPALAHIRRASDTVLKELAAVVGVLRGGDDLDGTTEPTRGLARLSELLDEFAAAGMKVEHQRHGPARELPALVDLAAYRIVQEALTNARKHGSGVVLLAVTYAPDAVLIDVSNTVAAAGPGLAVPSGYGLVGMRERAAAAGGTVTTGVQDGGRFAVHAELPAAAEVHK